MTAKSKSALGIVMAIPVIAATLYWIAATAFMPRAAAELIHDAIRVEQTRQQNDIRDIQAKLDRVLCFVEAQAGERAVSQCVR